MKSLLLIFFLIILQSCSKKPKAVLICGDHICVNKAEAEQYFEENLSIEVKILKKENKEEVDLVQLNLENMNNEKNIKINKKQTTENNVKALSRKEINEIKKQVKIKSKIKKKGIKNYNKERIITKKNIARRNTSQGNIIFEDICKKIKKCNINEITKYIINEGKKKSFPDITKRQ